MIYEGGSLSSAPVCGLNWPISQVVRSVQHLPLGMGLYVAGEGTSTDTLASRGLTISGWHEGFQYDFSGTDAWLDVKYGSRDRFAGDFSTQWWSGTFDAEVCEAGNTNSADDESQEEDTGSSE